MLLTRDEKHMLTAEELRLRAQKRRRLLLVLLLLLLLAPGVYFAARPTRNAIKSWQARRHANKAFSFIDQGKWQEARDEAVAAYQLRQTEPQALRAVARFLSRTRQQQAFEFWDQLAQLQPLTRDDLRDEAAVALASNELGKAADAVNHLLGNDGKDTTPHDWILDAQLHLQQGAPEKSLDSLGKLFAQRNASAREKFQGTLLQLQGAHTGNAEVDSRNQADAWQRLNGFALSDDAVALDSLVLLAQRQLASNSEAGGNNRETEFLSREELVRRLETHPLAKAPQKLLAIDLQIQANQKDKEVLIARAIADWKDADASQLAVLATWLNGKGEFERNLEVIPLDRALQSRELFLQHMDALGALGRWDEIDRLLDSERFPLDPVAQHMYLARANAQLGQEAAAKNSWQRALEAAAGDVGKLITLAEYGEKNGALDIADAAYTRAAAGAPKLRAAQQGRLRTAQAAHDTKRMHIVLAEMLPLWPNDTAIQNDEAYTRLILLPNEPSNMEQLLVIEKLAEKLVQREPASLPHRTLLALVRLKQHRPVAALQVYDGINVAPNALTPSALAVHAAVLSANGHTEEARAEMAKVPNESLLPEEQEGTANLRE